MRHPLALLLVSTLLTLASPARGQIVTGTVVEDPSGHTLADVEVRLFTTAGRVVASAVTDSAGTFRLQAPRFGEFRLQARMLGMADVATDPFTVQAGAMEVVLRMAAEAVPLEPLTVAARGREADLGFLTGYYQRMEWNSRAGIGRFITRDAIDARNPVNVSDMLREIPRVQVLRGRGGGSYVAMRNARGECTPALYVDGMRANRRDRAFIDEFVRPGDVEGVEVYVGLAQLPGEYHDENHCGVLLVWTRRTAEDGRPFTWRRALIGAGLFGGVLLLMR
jgi:hypothetical protein